jgi:hypothetical protein
MNIETLHRIPQKRLFIYLQQDPLLYAKIAVQFELSTQIGGFVVAFSDTFISANIAVPQTAWSEI